MHQSMFFSLLALGEEQRFDEALEAVAKGETIAQQRTEHWWHAELCRIKGDLIRAGTAQRAESAEQSYLRSLEIAKKQWAKSWECGQQPAWLVCGRRWGDTRRLATSSPPSTAGSPKASILLT